MPAPLPRCIERQILHQQRTRADEAHVTFEHVPELWKLVETGRSQELAEAGEPFGIREGLSIAVDRVRHRSKFHQQKGLPVPPGPLLPEIDRRTELYPYEQCDDQDDRREEQEGEQRSEDVDGALQESRSQSGNVVRHGALFGRDGPRAWRRRHNRPSRSEQRRCHITNRQQADILLKLDQPIGRKLE